MSENDVSTNCYLPLRLLLSADNTEDSVAKIPRTELESIPEEPTQPESVEQQNPGVGVEGRLNVVRGHGRWDGWVS